MEQVFLYNFVNINFSSKISESFLNILGLFVKICPDFGNSGCSRNQVYAHKLSFLSIHVGISEDTRLLNLYLARECLHCLDNRYQKEDPFIRNASHSIVARVAYTWKVGGGEGGGDTILIAEW